MVLIRMCLFCRAMHTCTITEEKMKILGILAMLSILFLLILFSCFWKKLLTKNNKLTCDKVLFAFMKYNYKLSSISFTIQISLLGCDCVSI